MVLERRQVRPVEEAVELLLWRACSLKAMESLSVTEVCINIIFMYLPSYMKLLSFHRLLKYEAIDLGGCGALVLHMSRKHCYQLRHHKKWPPTDYGQS